MADLVIASTANASMSDYPLLLQATGGDPALSYTGPDFRTMIDAAFQEGVCGMTDFRVVQRNAGANLSVDIGAGKAVVLGDSVTRQGKFVADSTGTVNTGTAGNITVPGSGTRTHRVILRIRDKQAAGTTYGYALEVLEDTGSGMPALPASAIDLASISVATGTVGITDAMITDRRAYACPHIPLSIQTLAADAATVEFGPGIPGFIKGLQISWNARCNAAGAQFVMAVRINGDSAANYARMYRNANGNGTANPTGANFVNSDTYIRAGILPGTSTSAGLFADGTITFPRWSVAGASTRVRALYDNGFYESISNCAYEDGQGYWVATAAPTRLTLLPSTGSMLAGSQFILKAIA